MDKLKQVIADALQVPVESVADDCSPATVPQWDSLAHLNLIMSLERSSTSNSRFTKSSCYRMCQPSAGFSKTRRAREASRDTAPLRLLHLGVALIIPD